MSSTTETISTEQKVKSTKAGSKKTGGKKNTPPKTDLLLSNVSSNDDSLEDTLENKDLVKKDNEQVSTDLKETDLQSSNVSSNDYSLEYTHGNKDLVKKVASFDASGEMDVVSESAETSDDEDHSEKTDENTATTTIKEKKPRLTKMQKLQLDAQKRQAEIQKRQAEIQKQQAELSKIIDEISQLDVSGKKTKKEPRTKTSTLVEPSPQFLAFMKNLSSLEEKPVFTKKTIESIINNYVNQEKLFVTFGSDADDKKTRSKMRNKDLEERGINTSSFNKPFNLDENLKTLFSGVEGFPTEYVLYSHITKYSNNLFRDIVTENK